MEDKHERILALPTDVARAHRRREHVGRGIPLVSEQLEHSLLEVPLDLNQAISGVFPGNILDDDLDNLFRRKGSKRRPENAMPLPEGSPRVRESCTVDRLW